MASIGNTLVSAESVTLVSAESVTGVTTGREED